MELKTKVAAQDGAQDIFITRQFDLPVELLFKAHTDADLVTQWMGTKVLKMDSRKHGSYEFETSDPQGNVAFKANGVIHELIPDKTIIKTFEMAGVPFGVQLEIYQFESLSADTSKLTIHTIYESVEQRDQLLKLPFAQGLSFAHNRLEETISKLK